MLWEYFRAGGLLMWPLLLCSLVSMIVCIERFLYWTRLRRRMSANQLQAILRAVGEEAFGEARRQANGSNDLVASILKEGLEDPFHGVSERMELKGEALLSEARRGMMILDTIITIAPLLGILGTVLGIINSFDLLSTGGDLEEPRAVLGGIATALITTAGGLAVSLLTLLPYNFFRARIREMAERISHFATLLEVNISKKQADETL